MKGFIRYAAAASMYSMLYTPCAGYLRPLSHQYRQNGHISGNTIGNVSGHTSGKISDKSSSHASTALEENSNPGPYYPSGDTRKSGKNGNKLNYIFSHHMSGHMSGHISGKNGKHFLPHSRQTFLQQSTLAHPQTPCPDPFHASDTHLAPSKNGKNGNNAPCHRSGFIPDAAWIDEHAIHHTIQNSGKNGNVARLVVHTMPTTGHISGHISGHVPGHVPGKISGKKSATIPATIPAMLATATAITARPLSRARGRGRHHHSHRTTKNEFSTTNKREKPQQSPIPDHMLPGREQYFDIRHQRLPHAPFPQGKGVGG